MKKMNLFAVLCSICLSFALCSCSKEAKYSDLEYDVLYSGKTTDVGVEGFYFDFFNDDLIIITDYSYYQDIVTDYSSNSSLSQVNEDYFDDNVILLSSFLVSTNADLESFELKNLSVKEDELLVEYTLNSIGFVDESMYICSLVSVSKEDIADVAISRFEVYSTNRECGKEYSFYNYSVVKDEDGNVVEYILKPWYKTLFYLGDVII